jgi:hypothetical protein
MTFKEKDIKINDLLEYNCNNNKISQWKIMNKQEIQPLCNLFSLQFIKGEKCFHKMIENKKIYLDSIEITNLSSLLSNCKLINEEEF